MADRDAARHLQRISDSVEERDAETRTLALGADPKLPSTPNGHWILRNQAVPRSDGNTTGDERGPRSFDDSMTFSDVQLASRRPVWSALSTLFLDTDTSLDRPHRAEALARSPHSIAEIERILRDEVFPVCSWSGLSLAGEWAGFDEAWLEDRILASLRSRRRWRLGFGHRLVTLSSEWRRTRGAVEDLRRT